ncbi:manganese efflux pump MntP [bioreactor metagenome]|uniref:Manganese efflux pump MntP n=1 Tax=bioreactor metagenome TaxID=1076179 RepID=A0A644ZDN9_9ZZZZ
MVFVDLLFIALAVSLDAFGVALCIGLNDRATKGQKLLFGISFGFFQFLFSLIGGLGGKVFTEKIASVPAVVGGIIISIVGVLMIKEGLENKGECPILQPKMYVILGVSVSIDAIVVGFVTLSNIEAIYTLLTYTLIIGGITLVMSIFAFIISRYLSKIEVVGKYADYIGGVILILFGLKMIFF